MWSLICLSHSHTSAYCWLNEGQKLLSIGLRDARCSGISIISFNTVPLKMVIITSCVSIRNEIYYLHFWISEHIFNLHIIIVIPRMIQNTGRETEMTQKNCWNERSGVLAVAVAFLCCRYLNKNGIIKSWYERQPRYRKYPETSFEVWAFLLSSSSLCSVVLCCWMFFCMLLLL